MVFAFHWLQFKAKWQKCQLTGNRKIENTFLLAYFNISIVE